MKEFEKYIEDNATIGNFSNQALEGNELRELAQVAYKEGYLEARADILELLRENDSQLFMVAAILLVKNMELPKFNE